MTPELKSRWITALRSGAFKQTRGTLKDAQGYCCLGVLCSIVKERYPAIIKEEVEEITVIDKSEDGEVIVEEHNELVGELPYLLDLEPTIIEEAMTRNDGVTIDQTNKQNFTQIADWLETVL